MKTVFLIQQFREPFAKLYFPLDSVAVGEPSFVDAIIVKSRTYLRVLKLREVDLQQRLLYQTACFNQRSGFPRHRNAFADHFTSFWSAYVSFCIYESIFWLETRVLGNVL